MTGDERYELFVDGRLVSRGPERTVRGRWAYATHDVELPAGRHVLVVRVSVLGRLAPWAQVSVRAGVMICAEDEAGRLLFGTGVAVWSWKVLPGYRFRGGGEMVGGHLGAGPSFDVDAREFDWGFLESGGVGWGAVEVGLAGNNGFWLYAGDDRVHRMVPGGLPEFRAEAVGGAIVRHASVGGGGVGGLAVDPARHVPRLRAEVSGVLRGRALRVGAHSHLRAVIDFNDYQCVYPRLAVRGGAGAVVEVGFAESLATAAQTQDGSRGEKGNRDEVDGKFFTGFSDRYTLDGGVREYQPLWWRCGRYVQLTVSTAEEPVELSGLFFDRAGYPLDIVGNAKADDPRLDALVPLCLSGLRACMHETYVDCPYYEQLMYIGDTRVQALMTHYLSRDDRLPRKAISEFAASRANATGLPTSNNGPAGQIIPPFALWWVCMVGDFAKHVGDAAFIRTQFPALRSTLEMFLAQVGDDHLLRSLPGWNYVDAAFPGGVPPGGEAGGVCVAVNLQLVLALDVMAELEKLPGGEPELGNLWERRAAETHWAVDTRFSSGDLIADTADLATFSEHTHALAILTGRLDPRRSRRIAGRLVSPPESWTRCQLYFTHYLFEAAAQTHTPELLFSRLQTWYDLQAMGFRSMPETFPRPGADTRSDCHAWSSHPMYHVAASIVGIRPAAMGFEKVIIRPMMGELRRASATVAHPRGTVHATLARDDAGRLAARIDLPPGVTGDFEWNGRLHQLLPGPTDLRIEEPSPTPAPASGTSPAVGSN